MSTIETQRSLEGTSDGVGQTELQTLSAAVSDIERRLVRRPRTRESTTNQTALTLAADATRGRFGYQSLQKWDGLVLTVDRKAGTFVTRLIDRTGRVDPIEAELNFDEL